MTATARKAPAAADIEVDALIRADQIRWQRQAATVLGRLLELTAKRDLPPLNWTVGSAGAQLTGECLSYPTGERRAEFDAWRQALGEPDTFREVELGGGSVQVTAVWDRRGNDSGNPLLADRDGWQLARVVVYARILPGLDSE